MPFVYTGCTNVDGLTSSHNVVITILCNTAAIVQAMHRHEHDLHYVDACTLCNLMQYRVAVIEHDKLISYPSR